MIAPDLETAIARLRELVEEAERDRAVHRRRHLDRMRHSRISARPAASGPRCGRSTSRDFLASQEMRDESLAAALRHGGAVRRRQARPRPPGAGQALSSAGKSPGVVTQNIDNLHQASGIAAEHVVELHGNTTYATCLDCAKRYELPWVKQRFDASRRRARLPVCGGYIKTATVSFGQAMPEAAMRRAEELTRFVRSLPRDRLLAGGLAGGGLSADGQAQRRAACHHQSRADRLRRHRRSRGARRHRRGARAFHRALNSTPQAHAYPQRCAQLATADCAIRI